MRIIRFGKERPADVLYRRSQVGIIGRYGLEEFIVYDGDCQWKDRAVMRAIIDDAKSRASVELNEHGELTLCGILSDIDVYPVQPGGSGTRRFIDKTDIDEAFRILKDKERVIRHTRNGRHPF